MKEREIRFWKNLFVFLAAVVLVIPAGCASPYAEAVAPILGSPEECVGKYCGTDPCRDELQDYEDDGAVSSLEGYRTCCIEHGGDPNFGIEGPLEDAVVKVYGTANEPIKYVPYTEKSIKGTFQARGCFHRIIAFFLPNMDVSVSSTTLNVSGIHLDGTLDTDTTSDTFGAMELEGFGHVIAYLGDGKLQVGEDDLEWIWDTPQPESFQKGGKKVVYSLQAPEPPQGEPGGPFESRNIKLTLWMFEFTIPSPFLGTD